MDAIAAAIAGTADFLRHGGVGALTSPTAGPVDEVRAGSTRCPDPVEIVRRVKEAGGTVVATGGCFDLLHAGHLRTLRAARALGDTLIVCLNADTSVTRLKGPERPLMPQDDRAELLLALDCVDAVAIFDEDTPLRILDELRPDIWVKGGDYIPELLPEHRLLSEWGGRCVAVPFHPGRSTTSLVTVLERISTDS
ncbi:adenylyltransferase/cytidyltransferase family protein [Raineyella fluvialis]|uniref:adenylyltransferase/cytidyltransferase family protein n=1 Tax=Raineyella fluvialis TaxID=2662261 RepID=UPI001EEFD433|nr:adenylyltransferase/cytidyltransferase family protein [Raineyella fluvialis]